MRNNSSQRNKFPHHGVSSSPVPPIKVKVLNGASLKLQRYGMLMSVHAEGGRESNKENVFL